MSVASRAPIEILGEIFLILRDKPITLHDLTNSLHFDEFPWAVGQICSHWRLAFLSYPALWSSLSLENPESEQPSPSAPYVAEMNRRTMFYLIRSEQHPLTITVRASNPSFCTIWTMLLSCSNRWQKAYLWIENESVMNGLVGRRGKMQILESLEITLAKFKRQKDLVAFEIAPHLTELEVTHWAMLKESRWKFPWIQLSKLKLEVDCLDLTRRKALQAFLRQIQNVEELRFLMNDVIEGVNNFEYAPVHFPRLRLLEISLVSPKVFSWFEAPLLGHLLVHDSCRNRYGEELSLFVHRSSCCVRRLAIQDCDIDVARDIIEVLKAGVEELCIKQMFEEVPGNFVDFAQDMIQSHEVPLPNLRVVQVPCCPGHFKQLIAKVSPFFEKQGGEFGSAPAGSNNVPLEKLIIAVDRNNCGCGQCGSVFSEESTAIQYALKVMCHWPSFSVVCLNYDQRNLVLTLHALVASTVVDLAIYYPRDPEVYEYCSEESYRHYNILLRLATV